MQQNHYHDSSPLQLHGKTWKETHPVVNTFTSCSPTNKLHSMASQVLSMEMFINTWLVMSKVLADSPRPSRQLPEVMTQNKTHVCTKCRSYPSHVNLGPSCGLHTAYLIHIKGNFNRPILVNLCHEVLWVLWDFIGTDALMLWIQPKFIINTLFHTCWCFISGFTSWMSTSHLIKIRITLPTKKDLSELRTTSTPQNARQRL